MFTKEDAIRKLMGLSLSREEAERQLTASLAERKKIVKGVQARLKAEKLSGMSPILLPHEGPPLPRHMGIVWPWKFMK